MMAFITSDFGSFRSPLVRSERHGLSLCFRCHSAKDWCLIACGAAGAGRDAQKVIIPKVRIVAVDGTGR